MAEIIILAERRKARQERRATTSRRCHSSCWPPTWVSAPRSMPRSSKPLVGVTSVDVYDQRSGRGDQGGWPRRKRLRLKSAGYGSLKRGSPRCVLAPAGTLPPQTRKLAPAALPRGGAGLCCGRHGRRSIKRPKSKPIRAWTDTEMAAYEGRWPLGSKQWTAYALMLGVGTARVDVHKTTWTQVDAGGAGYTRNKTGVPVDIGLDSGLRAALDAAPRSHVCIVTTEFGREHGLS
jgi:hypothetical protein